MMKTSKLIERITGPSSKAWVVGDRAFELMDQGKDIIHLGIGDPDFDTPIQIVAAIGTALDNGKTHYSPLAGEAELRNQIAVHANTLYGDGIESKHIAVLPGAQAALFSSFLCISGAGDEVIILEPTYATYPAVIQANGAKLVTIVLESENDYQINLPKIKETSKRNKNWKFLCNYKNSISNKKLNINLYYKFSSKIPSEYNWYSLNKNNEFIPSFTKKIFKQISHLY